jgi:hypothetical protein
LLVVANCSSLGGFRSLFARAPALVFSGRLREEFRKQLLPLCMASRAAQASLAAEGAMHQARQDAGFDYESQHISKNLPLTVR